MRSDSYHRDSSFEHPIHVLKLIDIKENNHNFTYLKFCYELGRQGELTELHRCTGSMEPSRPLVKSAYKKNNFLISQPKHMLWVLNEMVLLSTQNICLK